LKPIDQEKSFVEKQITHIYKKKALNYQGFFSFKQLVALPHQTHTSAHLKDFLKARFNKTDLVGVHSIL